MSLIDDLDKLDKLILRHAKESQAANLRNQASLIREQIEALLEDKVRLSNGLRVLENTSKQKIEELERHVMKLEDDAGKTDRHRDVASSEAVELPNDSKAILTMLARGSATLAEVADHFNHSPGNAELYLEILRGRKLVVREPGVLGGRHMRQARYRINSAGREWLLAHGISP